MRRLRLSTLLAAVNVGLLLLAVTGVAFAAARLLQRLADEQALARTSQAAILARQQIDSAAAAMVTSAQLLGERPTLRRLLLEQNEPDLSDFLARFQETSQLDGAAVLTDGSVIAQSGADLPWAAFNSAPSESDQYTLLRGAQGPLVLGARADVSSATGSEVVVATLLDQDFAAYLSSAVGITVTIVNRDVTDGLSQAALETRAIQADSVVSERIDSARSYVAAVPLHAPGGEIVGLIETQLPTAGITNSLRQLVLTLGFLTLGVAMLAGLISVSIGSRLSRPLRLLTNAAARIGYGDLATPVDLAPGREIGTLSATLDEMRARLLGLTDDLRHKQAEAEAIVTGIVEGVFSVDRGRRIRYLNPQAATILGIAPEAAIGRFCGDVLHPLTPSEARPCHDHCPIIHARFRGGARATEHLLLAHERRTVVITSAPAMGDAQMQVMRDETEVEATRRLRDMILANISHEFRTPLSAQLASIELLLHQLPEMSTAQIGDLVLAQQRSTLRLMQLIDNLLESARIEAGKDRIRQQPVALDEVVEDALELTRPLLDQREQEAILDLPYPLPAIRGDARRLTQVFVNLLGNANKYAPAASTITIGGKISTTTITLWVDDQGPGLPAGGQESWGRFERAPAGEPEQSGFGLGLSLVKSIVERHGGQVQACNTGTGTRMSMTFPLEHT